MTAIHASMKLETILIFQNEKIDCCNKRKIHEFKNYWIKKRKKLLKISSWYDVNKTCGKRRCL